MPIRYGKRLRMTAPMTADTLVSRARAIDLIEERSR